MRDPCHGRQGISTNSVWRGVASVTLYLIAGLPVLVQDLHAQTSAPDVRLDDVAEPFSRPAESEWQVEASESHLVAGVVIGGAAGIIGGLVLYEVFASNRCDPADNNQYYTCELGGPGAVGSAAIFGAIGALVGGVIGSAIPSQSFSVRPYAGPSSGLGLMVRAPVPRQRR